MVPLAPLATPMALIDKNPNKCSQLAHSKFVAVCHVHSIISLLCI